MTKPKRNFENRYELIARRLPPRVAARLDLRRPSLRFPWGGPLNGQERRCELLQELATSTHFDLVIETGTYRGTSTELFAALFDAPIISAELDPRMYHYSKRRLSPWPSITVQHGDSRAVLERSAENVSESNETLFAYLDAHWQSDLPLAGELEIIASNWKSAIVMIDDFQVPDDEGYRFDGYGEGKALTREYLPTSVLSGWSLYYPIASSSEETGAMRGCCVLMSPELSSTLKVPSLRFAEVL